MQHDLASMIKEKKLFLLDIDGTVALGSELLPGAADFLYTVKEKHVYDLQIRAIPDESFKKARFEVKTSTWGKGNVHIVLSK